jgi:hypothetical protein
MLVQPCPIPNLFWSSPVLTYFGPVQSWLMLVPSYPNLYWSSPSLTSVCPNLWWYIWWSSPVWLLVVQSCPGLCWSSHILSYRMLVPSCPDLCWSRSVLLYWFHPVPMLFAWFVLIFFASSLFQTYVDPVLTYLGPALSMQPFFLTYLALYIHL